MLQQRGCRFLSHTGDTGYVVDLVAHKRQQIDNECRRHTKLRHHTIVIHGGVVHGVYERDVVIDQLRHIFVTGGDDDVSAALRCLHRERADDIVCLDTTNTDERQAHRANSIVYGVDLLAQLIGHGRPVGLVLCIDLVSKGGPLGVEHDDDLILGVIGHQLADHANDAFGSTGIQSF